jgi:hypothetical protein
MLAIDDFSSGKNLAEGAPARNALEINCSSRKSQPASARKIGSSGWKCPATPEP